jgi:hypothetical protein
MSSVENKATGSTTPVSTCPHCGALVEPADKSCWLCLKQLDEPVVSGREPAAHLQPLPMSGYSLASLMMFMTLAAVVLGVTTQWPGIGIPLGVVALVIWSRTVNIVRQRATEGVEVSSPQKIHIFMSSFGMTLVILLLVVVTGGAALGAACAAIITTMDQQAMPWFIGLAILAIGGFVALIYLFRAINRRNARR